MTAAPKSKQAQKSSTAAKVDPRPAAAFGLGYGSCYGDVVFLDDALRLLRNEIEPNPYSALLQLAGRLEVAWRELDLSDRDRAWRVELDIWKMLETLERYSEVAIHEQHALRPWYRLGAVLGRIRAEITKSKPSEMPEISAIIRAVQQLPHEFIVECRIASHLSGLDAESDQIAASFVNAMEAEALDKPANEYSKPPDCLIDNLVKSLMQELNRIPVAIALQAYGPNRERDEYIYKARCNQQSHKVIIAHIRKQPGWGPISNGSGINKAADKYAKFYGLDERPRGKAGRPRKKN